MSKAKEAAPEGVGDVAVAERVGDGSADANARNIDKGDLRIVGREAEIHSTATKDGLQTSESTENLPESVKRRLKALKRLQLETTNLEAKFYEEVQQLEVKYHQLYTPLFEKRTEIVTGKYEPNDDECQWDLDSDKDEEEEGGDEAAGQRTDADKKKAKEDKHDKSADKEKEKDKEKRKDEEKPDKEKKEEKDKDKDKPKIVDDVRGIPDFWLTIFKNVQMLSDMVQEHDEPILKHLVDVKVVFNEANPMTFVLEFHFSPNEYFSDQVLTKEYEMKCAPDEEDPFSFEGPEIFKCKGCDVNWKKGMNVTVKLVKKKQKHKSRGVVRTVVKPVQRESFFNFFSPPALPDDPEAEVDDETYALVTSDIETGHYIRERIVPRAVLYYTGEALDDEEFEEELSSSDEDDSSEEEEDEEDENEGEEDSDAVPKSVPESPSD